MFCIVRQYSTLQPPKVLRDPLLHIQVRDRILGKNRQSNPDFCQETKQKINLAISNIHQSLSRKDVPKALQSWRSLHEHADLNKSRGQLFPAEELMAKFFKTELSGPNPKQEWDDETQIAFEDFALRAAKIGQTEVLYLNMLNLLKLEDHDGVIRLYDTFFKSLNSSLRPNNPSTEDIGDPFDTNDLLKESFDPGRASVLLAAIAAYAMKDSFQSAFDTYVASGIRIHYYSKYRLLKQLPQNRSWSTRLATYIHRLEISYLVLRPPSFTKQVTHLAQSRAISTLISLYDDVLNGISGEDPYIAATPSHITDKKLVAITQTTWSAFQTAFLRCNRQDRASRVWEDMHSLQVRPSVTMWTGLLDFYAELRDSRKCSEMWNMMLAAKVRPDVLSYRAIIAALFDDRKQEKGLALFREYQTMFDANAAAGIAVYNTAIAGLLRGNQYDEASTILNGMKRDGPAPDVITFNTFLAYHARRNDFRSLAAVMTDLGEANITGDVVTFSTILTALLRVGRKDATGTILNLMKKQGVQPNVATYTAIITSQMNEQSEYGLQAALSLLERLEKDSELQPNEVTYTSILASLYRGQWLPPDRVEVIKQDLLRRMKTNKVPFTLRTYHILIRAALDSKDPEGYKDALAYLLQMEQQGIPRVQTTWHLLLSGLIHRKEWGVAEEMINKMFFSGHKPTPAVANLVNIIRQRR